MISDIKQLSNEKKQHFGMVLVGTVVVLVIVFMVVIRPTQASLATLGDDIAAADKK